MFPIEGCTHFLHVRRHPAAGKNAILEYISNRLVEQLCRGDDMMRSVDQKPAHKRVRRLCAPPAISREQTVQFVKLREPIDHMECQLASNPWLHSTLPRGTKQSFPNFFLATDTTDWVRELLGCPRLRRAKPPRCRSTPLTLPLIRRCPHHFRPVTLLAPNVHAPFSSQPRHPKHRPLLHLQPEPLTQHLAQPLRRRDRLARQHRAVAGAPVREVAVGE